MVEIFEIPKTAQDQKLNQASGKQFMSSGREGQTIAFQDVFLSPDFEEIINDTIRLKPSSGLKT